MGPQLNNGMSTVIDKSGSGAKLEASLEKHCKNLRDAERNARVWALETKIDEKYARTQRRFLGTSGNVEHTDPNALMGAHFTLTVLQQPTGHKRRCTTDEEKFFRSAGTTDDNMGICRNP